MSAVKWTPDQENAILGFGGDILISAAAGSGKTAVLSERVMHHITKKNPPISPDRLLIVTFSKAAAAEMKQRILQKLRKQLEEDPGNSLLIQQQLLMESAQISTIHAFCTALLRQNFHTLGLPADFKIGSEQELAILRRETLKQVIEQRYTEGSSVFFDLVELISGSKDDRKLEETVLKLYDFIRNHAFYDNWLSGAVAGLTSTAPFESTAWYSIIVDYIADVAKHCKAITAETLMFMRSDEQLSGAYTPAFSSDFSQMDSLLAATARNNWDMILSTLSSITFDKLGTLRKYEHEDKKDYCQSNRKEVKDLINKLKERIPYRNSAEYLADNASLTPIIGTLFSIVSEFDSKFSEQKLSRNLLDFGDLEHYTLALLYNDDQSLSEMAKELASNYDEILIDEYQDTNGTQEMIFEALSSDNRFLVGDVKQSIYRFRQARPENFLAKKANYTVFGNGTYPAKISLSANFRTRRETTGVINYIFSMIMSKKVGEMEYLDEDMLFSKGSFDYSEDIPVRMIITDTSLEEDDSFSEAQMVANEIKKMLDDKMPVKCADNRPVTPGDICILLRSRTHAQSYIDELEKLGISSVSDTPRSFLKSREVAPIISYLKIISNPQINITLAEVLCSYLYGMDSETLATLRLDKKTTLYSMVIQSCDKYPVCKQFVDDLLLLREIAATATVPELIHAIYAMTSAQHKVAVMSSGQSRYKNLQLLAEYAGDYRDGLDFHGFVYYLYSLDEQECDLASASVAQTNAITIMSVHKSKGLEFPVVFFCDTATKFNIRDLSADTLLHPELGFTCAVRDNRTMTRHKTLPLYAMSLENKRSNFSEELRVLYVALTRAKERLIITATDKKLSTLAKMSNMPLIDGKLSELTVRNALSYYEWLLASLIHHCDFPANLLPLSKITHSSTFDCGNLTVEICNNIKTVAQSAERETEITVADPLEVEKMLANMQWQYPFEADKTAPIKFSVTDLAKAGNSTEYLFSRVPIFSEKTTYSPTQRGISTHKFVQFADFVLAKQDIVAEKKRLLENEYLTEWEVGGIIDKHIQNFFSSDICARILGADKTYRELRFMQELTPDEMEKLVAGAEITGNTVVQGIADCVIIEGENAVLIDYKTDRTKSGEELVERYSAQLNLYSYILEQVLHKKITEKIIYSFHLGKAFIVD